MGLPFSMRVFLDAGEYAPFPQIDVSVNENLRGRLEVEVQEELWELYVAAQKVWESVQTIFYQKYKEAGGTV